MLLHVMFLFQYRAIRNRRQYTNNNRLGRGDVLNISALGNLMLPRGLCPRGNIKLPRADLFNSHPDLTSCYLFCHTSISMLTG